MSYFCKFMKLNCYVVLVLYLQKYYPSYTTISLIVGEREAIILGVLDLSIP